MSQETRAARRSYRIETAREEDGRWIAEVTSLPGVMAYGQTKEEAIAKVEALALRVLADKIESDEAFQESVHFTLA